MSGPQKPILIAGGGIGGLATALALSQRGLPSIILERQAVFEEAGAGIQLGPNGMRVLADLGVDRFLEPQAGKPTSIRVLDAVSGNQLADWPIGDAFTARHGAPYRTAHRADLQGALLEAVRQSSLITVLNSFEVKGLEDDGTRVRAIATGGRVVEGTGAIASDGVWSRIRRTVFDDAAFPPSTYTAARTLIPADEVTNPAVCRDCVSLWLTRDAHIVHYPIRAGRQIAVVFVTEGVSGASNWSTPAELAELAPHLARLAHPLRSFLEQATEWRKWSLYDVRPLKRWVKGRIALLGDAAHPVLPFFAQGGVLALEDAVTAAACLAHSGGNIEAAFLEYEQKRRPRGIAVQRASRNNGRIYHLSGPMAYARNTALRVASPERMLARYDWLYGWRA